ncbi:MAG: hypothetical protein M0P69_18760, partial [Bacteroidales bacterium]|nr:hypothetical protein [Bacteroidales bacterium]
MMCRFKSGMAVYVNESDVRVFTSINTDSHTDIRDEYNIRDDMSRMSISWRTTPLEYIPGNGANIIDPQSNGWDGWTLNFDAGRPDWWTEAHTKSATKQMRDAVKAHIDGKSFSAGGYIDLGNLTS